MSHTGTALRLSASNYLTLFFKIIITIVLTRQMFLQLTHQDYGFWVLLWSIFGYSVLLDFGLGTALQKATSEAIVKQHWMEFNKQASTIVGNYVLLAFVIAVATVIAAPVLEKLFVLNDGSGDSSLQRTFIVFGIGTALLFPLGIFSEVLRGAQLIHVRNAIELCRELVNCVALVSALMLGWTLEYLALLAVFIQFVANIVMCCVAHRYLPRMRLSYTLYQPGKHAKLLKFSLVAYVVMLTNLLIYRTDQIVISVFSGVALVALYHVGVRVAELFRQLSSQLHDVLSPMAASLHCSRDSDGLRCLYQDSLRYVTFLVAIGIVPGLMYIDELIEIWLQLDDAATVLCAQILLLNTAVLVILRNTSNQLLLMCGHHRSCMMMGVVEALANLLFSIILLEYFGIIGVALGTLIPNIAIAVLINVPLAARFAALSQWQIYSGVAASFCVVVSMSSGLYWLLEYWLASYSQLLRMMFAVPVLIVGGIIATYAILMSDTERAAIRCYLFSGKAALST